jgi:hypothetical protein
LRFDRCTPLDLARTLGDPTSRPGVRRARLLVALARSGVDSPPETRLRLTLLDGGIRAADIDVNLLIRTGNGVVLAQGDVGSWRLMLWGESDGEEVHSQRRTFHADRAGDRWLEARGWHVLRFSADDWQRPERVVSDWRRAVANAPARIRAMDAGRSPELAWAKSQLASPRPSRRCGDVDGAATSPQRDRATSTRRQRHPAGRPLQRDRATSPRDRSG